MPPLSSYYATFEASIRSVGTAITLAAVGIYLHQRGFVAAEGKRTLAKISQQVTFPLFLFTKIIYCNQNWSDQPCPDITKTLQDVWILLLWPAYVVGVGLLVGKAAAAISGTPKSQVRSVLAACMFGNSTGLCITLLTVVHANFPDTSELGHVDPTLFLSVYLLTYPILQWGVGGWLLAPEDEETTETVASQTNGIKDEASDSFEEQKHQGVWSYRRNVLNNNQEKERWYKHFREGITETDASMYLSMDDLTAFAAANNVNNEVDDHIEEERKDQSDVNSHLTEAPAHEEVDRESPPDEKTGLLSLNNAGSGDAAVDKTKVNFEGKSFYKTLEKILSRCLQPPVIGGLLGILFAATPLRGWCVDLVDRSSNAPFEWLFDGLYAVGEAAVPINMMILGCNLSASQSIFGSKSDSAAASNVSDLLSNKTMAAIIIGKMVVMPFIGILSAIFLEEYVMDIPDEIDGSFYLVMMIVFLTPTANNVMVMVELSGSNTKEGIAQVIALQYAAAPIILSLTMSVAVGIASSWS